MRWSTKIWALSPVEDALKLYSGPIIDAPSRELAQKYCDEHGLGYCRVADEVVGIDFLDEDVVFTYGLN